MTANKVLQRCLDNEQLLNAYLMKKIAKERGFAGHENDCGNNVWTNGLDTGEVDAFFAKKSLMTPENRVKFLQHFEDAEASVVAFRAGLAQSGLSEETLDSTGPLFLYFDDLHIENQRLNAALSKLNIDCIEMDGAEEQGLSDNGAEEEVDDNEEEDDAFSTAQHFAFDDYQCDYSSIAQLEAELNAINENGKQLLREKENLENEMRRFNGRSPGTSDIERELTACTREIVHLKAKTSAIRLENRYISSKLSSVTQRGATDSCSSPRSAKKAELEEIN